MQWHGSWFSYTDENVRALQQSNIDNIAKLDDLSNTVQQIGVWQDIEDEFRRNMGDWQAEIDTWKTSTNSTLDAHTLTLLDLCGFKTTYKAIVDTHTSQIGQLYDTSGSLGSRVSTLEASSDSQLAYYGPVYSYDVKFYSTDSQTGAGVNFPTSATPVMVGKPLVFAPPTTPPVSTITLTCQSHVLIHTSYTTFTYMTLYQQLSLGPEIPTVVEGDHIDFTLGSPHLHEAHPLNDLFKVNRDLLVGNSTITLKVMVSRVTTSGPNGNPLITSDLTYLVQHSRCTFGMNIEPYSTITGTISPGDWTTVSVEDLHNVGSCPPTEPSPNVAIG